MRSLVSFRVGHIDRMANFGLQQANYAFLPVDSELSQTSSIRTFKIPVEKWNSPAEKHTIGFSEQVSSVILFVIIILPDSRFPVTQAFWEVSRWTWS